MKPYLLRCPSCTSHIELERVLFSAGPFCPQCSAGVRLPHAYLISLRLIRLALSALVSYALGVRGERLLWATFLIPLPLDVFNLRSVGFHIRLGLSALVAYLLGLRGVMLAFGMLVMMVPIDGLFRFIAVFLPTPDLKIHGCPKCPACSSEVSYKVMESSLIFPCPGCHRQLRAFSEPPGRSKLVQVLSTVGVVLLICAFLYARDTRLRDVLLFLLLLNGDLSQAFVGVPALHESRQKFTSLNLSTGS